MENKILKIFTFIIVTITALILIFKPELVRTMIPGIVENVYVAINKIIPIERKDDLKLTIIIVAVIMPIFAGIMRSISDSNLGGIGLALFYPLAFILGCVLSIWGIGLLVFLFVESTQPILFVIISYLFCCYLIFSDLEDVCNCDGCNQCCAGECY